MTPPPVVALVGLTLSAAVLIVLALLYLRRVEMPRPPIGTYRWSDIVVMSAAVILAPLGYLALPRPAVATVFGLMVFVALQLTLAPLAGGRTATGIAVVSCAATAAAALVGLPGLVTGLTDTILVIAIIGVANLWIQSGMRASHVAGFAGMLAGYDVIATSFTSLMTRFVEEVAGLPFAPIFALSGGQLPASIGLGDLL